MFFFFLPLPEQPENKYSKVRHIHSSKPSRDCDWRGHFPNKPPWLAQLPVDILSMLHCFLVKNELKTTHPSPEPAFFAGLPCSLSDCVFISYFSNFCSPTHWHGMCIAVFHLHLCRILYIQTYLQAYGEKKKKWWWISHICGNLPAFKLFLSAF